MMYGQKNIKMSIDVFLYCTKDW